VELQRRHRARGSRDAIASGETECLTFRHRGSILSLPCPSDPALLHSAASSHEVVRWCIFKRGVRTGALFCICMVMHPTRIYAARAKRFNLITVKSYVRTDANFSGGLMRGRREHRAIAGLTTLNHGIAAEEPR
jgi:hypothetical protein